MPSEEPCGLVGEGALGSAHAVATFSLYCPRILPHRTLGSAPDLPSKPTHISTLHFSSQITMDFAYAPPPPPKGKRKNLPLPADKRAKLLPFADLPTHLPNTGVASSSKDLLPQNDTTVPETAEEPPLKDPKEPVFIEGTNITLQTDEDIAKWIEERRKNWPTKKNIELKKNTQQKQKTLPAAKSQSKQVCKFYARTGKCKFGSKCRNLHETSSGGPITTINGLQVAVPQRYKKEMPASGSLYKSLVQRDLYEHENNVVLDFLQYLDEHGLIDRNASA